MKIKTSELTGVALDWAVAKCESVALLDPHNNEWELCWTLLGDNSGDYYQPSCDWAQGGPIIGRENMTFDFALNDVYGRPLKKATPNDNLRCICYSYLHSEASCAKGSTHLIAAMRCYVVSKLGDEVEIPKELT